MDANAKKLETINHLFKVHGKSTDRCHEPSESCAQSAIRAHSIPSGSVLAKLADDGHVVMPKLKLKYPPPAEISFTRVGINQATTFTGLCSQHDNDIFRPIDDAQPDVNEPSHLFLLAYRAVLREFHVCLQNAIRFQSTYQKRTEVGLSPGTEPCNFGMFATDHLINAYESYEYKRRFDEFYLNSEWSHLHHRIIVLENQPPTIAVSSMFSLDDYDAAETPRVTLSVFPVNDCVIVAFSALTNDFPFVDRHLDRILAADGAFQKYLLSKLILQSCENFVLAPAYFDALAEDRKVALRDYFVGTIHLNADDHDDERLYLF